MQEAIDTTGKIVAVAAEGRRQRSRPDAAEPGYGHERRSKETAGALREEFGVPALPVVADIGDRQAVNRALDEARAEFGAIDILVNNAAVNVQGSIFDYDPEDWDDVINVDLTAGTYNAYCPVDGHKGRGMSTIITVK